MDLTSADHIVITRLVSELQQTPDREDVEVNVVSGLSVLHTTMLKPSGLDGYVAIPAQVCKASFLLVHDLILAPGLVRTVPV